MIRRVEKTAAVAQAEAEGGGELSAQHSSIQEKQRTSTLKSDPDIATFEKHTKGFGMKMMQAMGARAATRLASCKCMQALS